MATPVNQFVEKERCPITQISQLLVLHDGRYLVVTDSFNKLKGFIYDNDTSTWSALPVPETDQYSAWPRAMATELTNQEEIVFLMRHVGGHGHDIAVFNWKESFLREEMRICWDESPQCMLLSPGKIHIFSVDNHCVAERASGQYRAVELPSIDGQEETAPWTGINRPKFWKKRNSIVMMVFHEDPASFMWPVTNYNAQEEAVSSMLANYNLSTGIWTTLKWTETAQKRDGKALICSNRGRYVFRFGSFIDCGIEDCNGLWVYDFKEETVGQSAVVCPQNGRGLQCVESVTSLQRENKTVYGYVRGAFKTAELGHLQAMPIHMLRMMAKWYCNEYIAVVTPDLYTGKTNHWSINVDKILENVTLVNFVNGQNVVRM